MSAQPTPVPRRLRDAELALGQGADFFWRVTRGVLSGRVLHYLGEVVRQARILTTGSTIVILAMALVFGLSIGIQGSYGARLVGAPAAAGAFTAIGDLREIMPYAFAYMMAAKVSTGYVAEIGTMRIHDEIDALDVMGMNSLVYLCSTRLLASWIVLPFFFMLAVLVCFAGSFIAVVVQIGQVSAGGYLELFWKFQNPTDYLFAATKCFAMGTFVVLVGVYHGFKVRGGPVEVGVATARAMIVNLIGIHAIGIIGTQLFWGGQGGGLPIGG
jgi:phospholipid/cholesterol/gamma-HCH transport system permease protein